MGNTVHKDKRLGGWHMSPHRYVCYSLDYIEACHAYWCEKRFINAARLWVDYAVTHCLERFPYDVHVWSVVERMCERQEFLELGETRAPRPIEISQGENS